MLPCCFRGGCLPPSLPGFPPALLCSLPTYRLNKPKLHVPPNPWLGTYCFSLVELHCCAPSVGHCSSLSPSCFLRRHCGCCLQCMVFLEGCFVRAHLMLLPFSNVWCVQRGSARSKVDGAGRAVHWDTPILVWVGSSQWLRLVNSLWHMPSTWQAGPGHAHCGALPWV